MSEPVVVAPPLLRPPSPAGGTVVVLISFLLVLVATGVLVLGLLGDGVALVYLSIACSACAGLTLWVAVKLEARRAVPPVSPHDREATPPAPDRSPAGPAPPSGEGAATGGDEAEVHAEGGPATGVALTGSRPLPVRGP